MKAGTKTYPKLENAARAYARITGAVRSGGGGGWIISTKTGKPVVQGWWVYGRLLMVRDELYSTGEGYRIAPDVLKRVREQGEATDLKARVDQGMTIVAPSGATLRRENDGWYIMENSPNSESAHRLNAESWATDAARLLAHWRGFSEWRGASL